MAVFRFLLSHDKTPQLFNPQLFNFGREGIDRKIVFALRSEFIFAMERWDKFSADQMSFVFQH